MSWVQTVVRQVGPYLSCPQEDWEALFLVREDRNGGTTCDPVVAPAALQGSNVPNG
ncbi:hypothetical protein UREOM_6870 [Ureaplasma sp. OM1]|uniref:Uncharacterized protein n=1 Tax=Ureaplasma ceti TaxID=3119530 RepID=A0ABP9UA18_9BACT